MRSSRCLTPSICVTRGNIAPIRLRRPTPRGFHHGARPASAPARPRRRERLRHPCFQRQQPGAGSVDHGGGSRDRLPVILQASRGARTYAGESFLRHLILAAVETYPDIPVVMHQDHGNSPATCYGAAANGFTSVMMDGSLEADAKTPASYDYNVAVTKEVVDVAHAIGVSVEGELVVPTPWRPAKVRLKTVTVSRVNSPRTSC